MAKLVLIFEDVEIKEYAVARHDFLIGRAQNASISLEDATVSSQHALLELDKDNQDKSPKFYLKDLSSKNGTYLDGKRISRIPLNNGDEFKIGWSTFRFMDHGESVRA